MTRARPRRAIRYAAALTGAVVVCGAVAGCSGAGSTSGTASSSGDPSTPPISASSTTAVTPMVAPTLSAPIPGAGAATTVDATFRSNADDVCSDYVDYNNTHEFPFPTFVPKHPAKAMLPQVGAFVDANPQNHTMTKELVALGNPATGLHNWQAAVALMRQRDALALEQIRVANAADVAGFVANVAKVAALPSIAQSLSEAGFVATDSCMAAF